MIFPEGAPTVQIRLPELQPYLPGRERRNSAEHARDCAVPAGPAPAA